MTDSENKKPRTTEEIIMESVEHFPKKHADFIIDSKGSKAQASYEFNRSGSQFKAEQTTKYVLEIIQGNKEKNESLNASLRSNESTLREQKRIQLQFLAELDAAQDTERIESILLELESSNEEVVQLKEKQSTLIEEKVVAVKHLEDAKIGGEMAISEPNFGALPTAVQEQFESEIEAFSNYIIQDSSNISIEELQQLVEEEFPADKVGGKKEVETEKIRNKTRYQIGVLESTIESLKAETARLNEEIINNNDFLEEQKKLQLELIAEWHSTDDKERRREIIKELEESQKEVEEVQAEQESLINEKYDIAVSLDDASGNGEAIIANPSFPLLPSGEQSEFEKSVEGIGKFIAQDIEAMSAEMNNKIYQEGFPAENPPEEDDEGSEGSDDGSDSEEEGSGASNSDGEGSSDRDSEESTTSTLGNLGNKFLESLTKVSDPINDSLLKSPQDITDEERDGLMTSSLYSDKTDLRFETTQKLVEDSFKSQYPGSSTTSSLIKEASPLPTETQPVKDIYGNDIEPAVNSIHNKLATSVDAFGEAPAVRGFQNKLNDLSSTDEFAVNVPNHPQYPAPRPIKTDGVFGQKTNNRMKETLVAYGVDDVDRFF
jgi:hypothetical protein